MFRNTAFIFQGLLLYSTNVGKREGSQDLKFSTQIVKDPLIGLQGFLKSPNFVPVTIKLTMLVAIPLVAFFQDFIAVFNLAWSDSEAQYVLLVPLVVAYFLYRRRKAFLLSKPTNHLQDFLGIALCLFALMIYVLGSYTFYSLQLHLIALPVLVAGATLLLFGADTLRLLIFPVALLAFLSPFPLFFMDAYGGYLMNSDGALAGAILSPFMPIDIVYQPIVIITTTSLAGEILQFSLSAACSGIYSLTAFLFCAVVFGYLASGSIVKKILYGVLAILAAYLLNVFRIVVTIILGRLLGLGIAVEFFHSVGGTVLAFVGTLLLLYFGTKLLKLSFTGKHGPICQVCGSAVTDVCDKCGKIVKWPKTKLNWKRLAIVLAFLVVCADLVVLASAVNYHVISPDDQAAIDFNPATGELAAFSNQTGWKVVYMGRESQAEQQLGLIYVGDYFLTKTNGSDTDRVYAIFEISDLQSKFHTWEGCLNYQSYPIEIDKITYVTIYDKETTIVNGEQITAHAPTLNQAINLIYWFDSLKLRTNGTVIDYAVKITLIKYVPDVDNQIDQQGSTQAQVELLALSQSLEDMWSQYKQGSSTFVVDLYKNGTAFTVFTVVLLAAAIVALFVKRMLMGAAAKKKFAALPEEDKALVNRLKKPNFEMPPPEGSAPRIEALRQQNIIRQKVTAFGSDIYTYWAPYYP